MEKKDRARMERRLKAIDEEVRAYKSEKNKKRLMMAGDLAVLLGTIIVFFLVLFHNPDMNYIPLLITTCAVTGLALVRAFSHGDAISSINRELAVIDEEVASINSKLEKGKEKKRKG